jgi:hypothetical protein
VELVINPHPDPGALFWLCQWLTETARGELEEMIPAGPEGASFSLRVFFYEQVPLAKMLGELAQVAEVREEELEGQGKPDLSLRRRVLTSRMTMKKLPIGEPSKRLYLALKSAAVPEPPPNAPPAL